MESMDSWFEKPFSPFRPRAERRPVPDLVVYYGTRLGARQEDIKDISSSGVYLLTPERWLPGALVPITLQRKGPPEESPQRRVTLQTRTVRLGEDGIGLTFVLPNDEPLLLWETPVESAQNQPQPESILGKFQMAVAVAFLKGICPSAVEQIRQLLANGLSPDSAAGAVEIALYAEKMLEREPGALQLRAYPHMVLSILEDGSAAVDGVIRQWWGGLLASSCTSDGSDESNQVYVDLLRQLAPGQVRILGAACMRASIVVSILGLISARPLSCTTDEIKRIAGSSDLAAIESELEHLAELGLLESRLKSAFFLPTSEAHITPTSLGLHMFARCSGHDGTVRNFYGAVLP